MITQERAMACHFQRTKSKFGFLKICMVLYRAVAVIGGLDAERRDLAPRQLPLVERLRHENGREQVDEETNRERHREAADRAGAELEEEERRDERRDVRVEQRQEHAVEAGVDRRAYAALGRQLFLDALEDEHVRVDADAHRQDEPGDAGQRHDRSEIRHQAEQDDEIGDERHDRVDARQMVRREHERLDQQQTDEGGVDARADRVAAERRTDDDFTQVGQRRRQRSGPQRQREIVGGLRREPAADPPLVGDPPFEPRRRDHAVVEDNRQVAADVLARQLAELLRAVRLQFEVDGRLIVLVETRLGEAKVLAGDGRDLAHDVVHSARLARRRRRARDQLHLARQRAVELLQQVVLRAGTRFDQLELEDCGLADDVLRVRDVGDARELDDDLVLLRLPGDLRLGDAELVDAAIDRLQRLVDRLLAQVALDDGLHPELVGPLPERIAVKVVGRNLVGRGAKRRVPVLRDAVDVERRRRRHIDVSERNRGVAERIAQLLARRRRGDSQGIVGVDAQLELHASLEVEPELERSRLERGVQRPVEVLGQQRVDAHTEEQGEDDEDAEELPAKVLVHGLNVPVFRNYGVLPLISADGRPGDLNPDLVRDLHLHRLVVQARNLPVKPARRHDLVAHLEGALEHLHLLLPLLHGQQDQEIEDAEDQGEGQDLDESAGSLGRARHRDYFEH